MWDSHLRELYIRRLAWHRALQLLTAIPLNLFLLITLNDRSGLLGTRNMLSRSGIVISAVFAVLALLAVLFLRRRARGGFWLCGIAYLWMAPWYLRTLPADWLVSVIGLLFNGVLAGATLRQAACDLDREPDARALRMDQYGVWGGGILWLNGVAVAVSIMEAGYRVVSSPIGITAASVVVLAALVVSIWLELKHHRPSLRHGPHAEWLLLALVLVLIPVHWRDVRTIMGIIALRQAIVYVRYFLRTDRAARLSRYFFQRPAQLIVLSFAVTILVGSMLLSFPYASKGEDSIRYIDALFTATSAVAVTGLVVLDTPVDFTPLGQFIIMMLIQCGGLGIMTLSTFAAIMLGRNIGLGHDYSLAEMVGAAGMRQMLRLVKFIGLATITIEALGAVLLTVQFLALGLPLRVSVWKGIFHAVSAFNNAGFALQSDNLVCYAHQPGILVTISLLIVLGGLGFGVLYWLWEWPRGRAGKIGFQVITVLVGTAVLLIGATLIFLASEATHAFASFSWRDRIVNAWFCAVTPRTAGFNAILIEDLWPANRFITMLLMFIGVAPGSTGGGIKITTVVVLLFTVRALMRGKHEVNGFGYALDAATVYRAGAVLTLCLLSCAVCVLVLLSTQAMDMERLAFEAVSAFGTVGLSMSVTPHLTGMGKLAVLLLMYVGRVGPLTLMLSLSPMAQMRIRYPKADVMIG
jgi:trk system potassium uptake protein TrkH